MSDAAPRLIDRAVTAYPRAIQWAVAFLLGAIVVLLGSRSSIFNSPRPTDRVVILGKLDLNKATREELAQIPEMGAARANAIVASREQRRGFTSLDELRDVSGIGPKRFEMLRQYVTINADTEYTSPTSTALTGSTGEKIGIQRGRKESPRTPIDINRASAAELCQLPGVGSVLAHRIIQEREKGPFRALSDLRRVSGIGPKTLEKLGPFVTFSTPESAGAAE